MILVNGRQTEFINVLDRGLQYGDGLFETITVANGQPLLWERHLERLSAGCRKLGIPEVDAALLSQEAKLICSGQSLSVLKIIITRGIGGRGYRAQQGNSRINVSAPTRILSIHPWPSYPERFSTCGITLRLCSTRLGINPALAGIKHLNRLEQVIARSEWDDPDIAEGLMLDSAGYVIEGTISNLFIVKNDQLITPDLSGSGVDGVMRGLILEIAAALSISTGISSFGIDIVKEADEIFLCNSLIRIWPVCHFDGNSYPHGAITQRIAQELKKYLHS